MLSLFHPPWPRFVEEEKIQAPLIATHVSSNQSDTGEMLEVLSLLAPTGALVLMMVYYISEAAPTFSDLEHLCLSILLQVSL